MSNLIEFSHFAACEIVSCLKMRIDFIRESGFDRDPEIGHLYRDEISRLKCYIDNFDLNILKSKVLYSDDL